MVKRGSKANSSHRHDGELSDRLPGIRSITITESCPDHEGPVVGLIHMDLKTRKFKPRLYDNRMPDDYEVSMLVRFREPYSVVDLALDVFDYVSGRLSSFDSVDPFAENKAVYIISGPAGRRNGAGPSVWIRPKDNRSKRHKSIEISCGHEDSAAILEGYAREELGKKARVVRRQGYR